MFQLTCLLIDISCPTCGETGLYISVCEGSDQRARFASKLALTCDLCEYKKFEMLSPRTQFSDKKNVTYEVNPRMVVFSHESSIGDNQMIMVLGIQAHSDDDFVPSFTVKLLFVAYFQLKIPKALVVIKTQLWNLTWCYSVHWSWFIQMVLLIKWKWLYLCNMEYIKIITFSRCLCKLFVKSQKWRYP